MIVEILDTHSGYSSEKVWEHLWIRQISFWLLHCYMGLDVSLWIRQLQGCSSRWPMRIGQCHHSNTKMGIADNPQRGYRDKHPQMDGDIKDSSLKSRCFYGSYISALCFEENHGSKIAPPSKEDTHVLGHGTSLWTRNTCCIQRADGPNKSSNVK